MSAQLHARLREHRDIKGFRNMIDQIPFMNLLSFTNDLPYKDFISSSVKEMMQIESQALYSIRKTSQNGEEISEDTVLSWLTTCLRQIGIGDRFYLHLQDFGTAPFADIQVIVSIEEWLPMLWRSLMSQEFLLIPYGKAAALYFFSEEHAYEIHFREEAASK
ncbi:hypothetical protein HC928_09635 [bacterium]|nr:hypothetical protein [bacterium]